MPSISSSFAVSPSGKTVAIVHDGKLRVYEYSRELGFTHTRYPVLLGVGEKVIACHFDYSRNDHIRLYIHIQPKVGTIRRICMGKDSDIHSLSSWLLAGIKHRFQSHRSHNPSELDAGNVLVKSDVKALLCGRPSRYGKLLAKRIYRDPSGHEKNMLHAVSFDNSEKCLCVFNSSGLYPVFEIFKSPRPPKVKYSINGHFFAAVCLESRVSQIFECGSIRKGVNLSIKKTTKLASHICDVFDFCVTNEGNIVYYVGYSSGIRSIFTLDQNNSERCEWQLVVDDDVLGIHQCGHKLYTITSTGLEPLDERRIRMDNLPALNTGRRRVPFDSVVRHEDAENFYI